MGGIQQAAILNNEEARIYYEQHRSWKRSSRKRPADKPVAVKVTAPVVKANRDVARARYRYLKMNKAELVERLLTIEQAYASQEELWLQMNEEVLTWRLRTERAEARPRAALPAPEPNAGL